jgi:N-methylhydantoinase B
MDLVVEIDKPAKGNTAGDGARHGACGLMGGADGLPHRYVLRSRGRPDRALKTKEVGIDIRPGDVLHVESGGGGGWGPARLRAAAARAADARNGFVAPPKAPTAAKRPSRPRRRGGKRGR